MFIIFSMGDYYNLLNEAQRNRNKETISQLKVQLEICMQNYNKLEKLPGKQG